MPTIPEESFRPSLEEAAIDLIKSVAMEETGIAHLLNAEAEKIQAFVGKDGRFPTNPTAGEIVRFNQSVARLIDVVVMEEWLLLRKLETIVEVLDHRGGYEECEE